MKKLIPRSRSIRLALFFALVSGRPGGAGAEAPQDSPKPPQDSAPAIKIVTETTLPTELARAADVRWAGDGAVYLAMRNQGVVEFTLGSPAASAKKVVPGREQLGGFWYATLVGASERTLVAAAPAMIVTTVELATKIRRDDPVDAIHALDVRENRLLLLAMRRGEQGKVGQDGAIAWLGPSDRPFDALKPVAYDATGPGIRNMMLCGGIRMGGVRFLADGRFVVVPGVQPGAQLYDREGRLLRTWDTGALADSDCGTLSVEASQALNLSIEDRENWINRRRTIDTVLPLPEGPGLVVRSLEAGRLRWDLWVLKEKGAPSMHRLPIDAEGEHFHLRGDFRAGKMIFLLAEERTKDDKYPAPRIFIALPPV